MVALRGGNICAYYTIRVVPSESTERERNVMSNLCSLKERNKVQHLVAPLHIWARGRAAIKLMDDRGDKLSHTSP